MIMKTIHHHLVSVNLTKKKVGKLEPMTGVFRRRTNTCTHWVEVVVSIDPLLASRMQTRTKYEKLPPNIPYVGHEFICPIKSPKYVDSPFRLAKFIPEGDSDMHINYRLEAVDRSSKSIIDEDLGQVVDYNNFTVRASKFLRYQVRKFTKKFEEIEEGTVIAVPNLQKIPV